MKKVAISIVVKTEVDAKILAREMEKSYIAQQGVYTLVCGDIEDLTEDEKHLVFSEVPTEYLND